MREIEKSDELTESELRLLHSQAVGLYFLLSKNKLNEMLFAYGRENRIDIMTLSNEQRMDMKTQLTMSFLERISSKAQETELAERFPHAPSTGFEYEYPDPLLVMGEHKRNIDREISILENIQNGEVPPELGIYLVTGNYGMLEFYEQYKDKKPEEILEERDRLQTMLEAFDRLLTVQIDPEQLKKVYEITDNERLRMKLIKLLELKILKDGLVENNSTNLPGMAQMMETLNTWERVFNQDVNEPEEIKLDSFSLELLSDTVRTQAQILSGTRAFKDQKEILPGSREVITAPSISVSMQMREFLHICEVGGLQGELAIHETVSGVLLDETHTDIMEVRAMLEAVTYFDKNKVRTLSNETRTAIKSGIAINGESYKKPSPGAEENSQLWFPYHRFRSEEEKKVKEYEGRGNYGVEFRSFPSITQFEFSAFVKTSNFIDLCAWGESFKQRQEKGELLTQAESDISAEWQNLLVEWQNLLAENNIEQPTSEERFEKVGDKEKREGYTHYLNLIELQVTEETEAQIPEENTLRYKTMHLIIGYRAKVNEIIKKTELETA